MAGLTLKQEAFCMAYIETGNASEAYRRAYDAEKMSENAVYVAACELLKSPKVSVRVGGMKEEIKVKHNITIESLLAELEEARQLALRTDKAGPAVAASMGKAKLAGLDKQIIDHTSTDGTMTPQAAINLSADAMKAIAAKINDGI